jgi:hypothetical protein
MRLVRYARINPVSGKGQVLFRKWRGNIHDTPHSDSLPQGARGLVSIIYGFPIILNQGTGQDSLA